MDRGPVNAGIRCLDSGNKTARTGGMEVESRAAGSRTPECGREGEPKNTPPGSAKRAEKVARSERSWTARPHGPVSKKIFQFHKNLDNLGSAT